jgi:hypothetical protein
MDSCRLRHLNDLYGTEQTLQRLRTRWRRPDEHGFEPVNRAAAIGSATVGGVFYGFSTFIMRGCGNSGLLLE